MNLSRSALRRRGSAARYLGRRHAVPGTPPARPCIRSTTALVADMLRDLSRRQRECLVLRYFADLDEEAIARTLGISRGSVKTHLHREMAAVRVRRMEVSDD